MSRAVQRLGVEPVRVNRRECRLRFEDLAAIAVDQHLDPDVCQARLDDHRGHHDVDLIGLMTRLRQQEREDDDFLRSVYATLPAATAAGRRASVAATPEGCRVKPPGHLIDVTRDAMTNRPADRTELRTMWTSFLAEYFGQDPLTGRLAVKIGASAAELASFIAPAVADTVLSLCDTRSFLANLEEMWAHSLSIEVADGAARWFSLEGRHRHPDLPWLEDIMPLQAYNWTRSWLGARSGDLDELLEYLRDRQQRAEASSSF